MNRAKEEIVKVSVRNLVEFILCTGDLNYIKGAGTQSTNAMQEGSRIHRKIQKQMKAGYHAEVPLSIVVPVEAENISFSLCIEGRADGIIEEPDIVIDEIKGVYTQLSYLTEPIAIHRFQVMCYAYMYAKKKKLLKIDIQLTYCQIETEEIKRFKETFSLEKLESWFRDLIDEYAKWIKWQLNWKKERTDSIKQIQFPFSYRTGQRKLAVGVYQTILEGKKLFIEAPTGVGKTISTVFPSVKAMGEGLISKIFYTTAKTITRTVAEEAFQLLREQGTKIKIVTITAKEKLCILKKAVCNPDICERAKGHYDRINKAVFELLVNNDEISRELIEEYAATYKVCPFEMCLDAALWCDGIICDYNYIFDPNVYLRRFFSDGKKQNYIFLVDEAHNLVERGREMYSAVLYKQAFLEVKSLVKQNSNKMKNKLEACNQDMLFLKRECEEYQIISSISNLVIHLTRLFAEYEEFLSTYPVSEERERVLNLYFDIQHFLAIYEIIDDKYLIYTDYNEEGDFRIKLQCVDPSSNLLHCLERGKTTIFFSATLLPIQYYKEQLGGTEKDYAIYIPSPFEHSNRLLMVGSDVSTKYTRRNEKEFNKIVEYIQTFVKIKTGNYLVFFPSYQMMNLILSCIKRNDIDIIVQKNSMSEKEREEFLRNFVEKPKKTKVGFCVIGGIFSEGIDLKNDRLIGTIIIGTGLPMICHERDIFRKYFDEKGKNGFYYAYQYPGMNKVLQSAGRVIRTAKDKGVVLLLDERFLQESYQVLFPREWFPYQIVTKKNIEGVLEEFWNETSEGSHF